MTERIIAAAVMVEGMTVSKPPPHRHHHLLHAVWNVNRKVLIRPKDQGFLTDRGRYVGREEALEIASAAGQIREKHGDLHRLYSEDLW